MPLFGRSRSRSHSESSSGGTPALPKTRPVFTSERRNILAAECRDLSAYYERLADLEKFSSLEPSTKSSSSSSVSPTSPASKLTDSSRSSLRSSGRVDNSRFKRTSHAPNLSSRGGSLPSLQGLHNRLGDAPASPFSQWDAFDVTSVDTAVNLLQGVASYHDVDRFIKVTRTWLKSIPRLNYLEAAAHIRSAASSHFFRVWDPSDQEALTFSGDASQNAGFAVARLFGMLLRAKVADCTDIALAAEFLFEHRQHEGYIRALYELINNAGDRVARPESLERMLALAEGLGNAKNEEGCHGVEEHADSIVNIIHFYESARAFRSLETSVAANNDQLGRVI